MSEIKSNPWTRISSKRYYESSYLDLDEDQVLHKSGKKHPYTALRFRINGIAVLPIDACGNTILVGQFRYVSNKYTWEIIRGSGPKTDSAVDIAHRELIEETGFIAGSILHVMDIMVSPGISDEIAPLFVAWNLSKGSQNLDEHETINLRQISFADAFEEVLSCKIIDAASVATILAVHARACRGQLPSDLNELVLFSTKK